jgi:hypothetical protein
VLTSVLDLNPADNSIALWNHIEPPLLSIGTPVELKPMRAPLVWSLPSLSGPAVDHLGGLLLWTPRRTTSFRVQRRSHSLQEASAAIVIYAIEDILDEPNRSFTVVLINPVTPLSAMARARARID